MSVDSSDLSKLLSSAVLVFVGTFFSAFAGIFERVLIGRILSPASYGEFSIALAILTLGATLGAAGFTQGVPRYMARFSDIRDVRGAWITGLLISSGLSLTVAVILIVSSPVIIPRLFEFNEAWLLFLIFVVAIPAQVILDIGIGGIRGYENTTYKVLTQNIFYPFVRVSLIAILLLTGAGIVGTGVGYFVALVASIVLTYFLLNNLFPLAGGFNFHGREMTLFSAPLIVSTIMTVLLTRTDTLMLGYFRPSAEVGVYNAAYPLAGTLTVVLGVFGYMYLPVASRLDSEEGGSVERVYEITTKWIYILIFPIFIVLIVYSEEIIYTVFGPEYTSGGIALAILAVGFFTNAAVGRNRETLSALGATKFILISNVIAFIINFFANLLLIPIYGFVGAAIASAGSFIALNIVVYIYLRAQFEITPFNQKSTKIFVSLPIILVPSGFFIRNIFGTSFLLIVLLGIASAIATVIIVLIIGGAEPEDIVLVEFVEESMNMTIPYVRRYIPREHN